MYRDPDVFQCHGFYPRRSAQRALDLCFRVCGRGTASSYQSAGLVRGRRLSQRLPIPSPRAAPSGRPPLGQFRLAEGSLHGRVTTTIKAHGASAKNVISETIYITGLQFMVEGDDIRRAFYVDAKAAFPTAAAVQVVALTYPALVLEVEIVAYLGD